MLRHQKATERAMKYEYKLVDEQTKLDQSIK